MDQQLEPEFSATEGTTTVETTTEETTEEATRAKDAEETTEGE